MKSELSRKESSALAKIGSTKEKHHHKGYAGMYRQLEFTIRPNSSATAQILAGFRGFS